jgi:hypothetical protein
MALEIPNSAVAVCSYQITAAYVGANGFKDATAIIAAINDELQGDGLSIAQNDMGGSEFFSLFSGNISGTMQILNQSGQELDDTDLQSQFTDACGQESMSVVTFGVLKVITGSGVGTNSGTGAQGNVSTTGAGVIADQQAAASGAPKIHVCGDPTWGFFQDPAQWLKCLTTGGLQTVGLLTIGLVLGVILIFGLARAGERAG